LNRIFAALLTAAFATGCLPCRAEEDAVRIGVLNNMTGGLSAPAGPGSVIAAQMAIDEFGGTVAGRPIRLLAADQQNKPDVGLGIARRWFDQGVDIIVDLPNTAVAIAVQKLAAERNRIAIVVTAAGTSLSGKECTANSMAWVYNSYALAGVVGRATVKEGGDTWFLLSTDYVFGREMQADLTGVLKASGGRLVGSVAAPQETTDFASFLLQAQASGAKVIGLANVATDTINSVKQAHEFGLVSGGQKLATLLMTVTDVKSLGLEAAGGLYTADAFYWDRTDAGREWSKRFYARHGAMPSMLQAGVYSAVRHYLQAVAATGTHETAPVLKQMRATPVNDAVFQNGQIRPSGLMVHDMFLAQVKTPAESHGPWDLYKIIATVPGETAFGPISASQCPLDKELP